MNLKDFEAELKNIQLFGVLFLYLFIYELGESIHVCTHVCTHKGHVQVVSFIRE